MSYMMERWKAVPPKAKLYFALAAFFMLLPALMPLYKGATGRALVVLANDADTTLWKQSVIYVVKDGFAGTTGIILNKPLDPKDAQAPEYLRNKGVTVYYGGPVDFPDQVFILDQGSEKASIKPLAELQAKDPAILNSIVASLHDGEKRYRIYLGSASWAPFQLIWERSRGVWGVTDFHTDWFEIEDAQAIWQAAYQQYMQDHPSDKLNPT